MEIINLTPHAVIVYDADEIIQTFEPHGIVTRLDEAKEFITTINGVKIFKKKYAIARNLPDPKIGTLYLVSSQIVDSLRQTRNDLIAPDDFVRNDNGNIIGCRSFWCG